MNDSLSVASESIEQIDEGTCAVYLEVPGSKVVLLQAYFELYEGVGVVRTLDIRTSLVGIVTTTSLLKDCIAVLEQIQETTGWRYAPCPKSQGGENTHPWMTAARNWKSPPVS